LWLGETYAGEFKFKGRTTERQELNIPMSYVISETMAGGGTQLLTLSKEGTGRLYYRLGLRYAPTDLSLDALDMGFVVTRRYEAVDDPLDVTQDADGVWHIKAGARVRVVVSMVADNRRYHVALVDRCPPGWRSSTHRWRSRRDALHTGPGLQLCGIGAGMNTEPGMKRMEALPPCCGTACTNTLYCTSDHAWHLHSSASQGRRNVLAGGVWAQQQRLGDY
jgi:hypothetical protein